MRRLIRVVASTEVFRLDSAADRDVGDIGEAEQKSWVVFPITRLRPEQVAGGVIQTSFHRPLACGPAGCGPKGCGPAGCYGGGDGACGPGGCGPTYGGMPPAFVAGITAPAYGMTSCGTPIGLPGPPHIPLGVPAGLQCHTIENHTHMSIPGPTEHVHVDVPARVLAPAFLQRHAGRKVVAVPGRSPHQRLGRGALRRIARIRPVPVCQGRPGHEQAHRGRCGRDDTLATGVAHPDVFGN